MNFYILIATKNSCLIEFEIADFFNEISRSTKVIAYLAPVGLIYVFRNTIYMVKNCHSTYFHSLSTDMRVLLLLNHAYSFTYVLNK